ncbi:hypothetical protein EZJ43_16540 [Pedobacter changchengzhani]|uniref:Lipoprotein n=1 Tax=Pedobacter changchengzhani TaxID=2529274 RepID=A0A4R5MH65_9SPHI|nr:hypothetical protein [Pedobacter changchengzhani]TDG34854.1 hypothetical protein EZJ43_16540 [Pedobacter changchengzhani]
MNNAIKYCWLLLVAFSMQACAQKSESKYFDLEFMGHKFNNVEQAIDGNRLTYLLYDNYPRDWYQSSTSQFLIANSGVKDTLLISVRIEFLNINGGVSGPKLEKGTFLMGKNFVGSNFDSKCNFSDGKAGPFIEVQTSIVGTDKSKDYVSGTYNFHHDSGKIVIEDIQKDSEGIGFISGYFEGTVSNETTTIDTHADEDAICKSENYKYETLPIKGKFRLRLKQTK